MTTQPQAISEADVRAAAREIGRKLYVPGSVHVSAQGGAAMPGGHRSLEQLRREVTLSPLAKAIVDEIVRSM